MTEPRFRPTYRAQKKLPVRRMLAGFLFLLTPSINLFDFLPDFIGCILIMSALFDASEVLPYFGDLRDKLKTYLWVSLSRYPALFVMMAIYSGDNSQRSIITVFAIGYAIVDLICLIPAISYFWDGFFYFGERFDCPAAIKPVGRVTPERLSKMTFAFFIARELASCLPEFALIPVSAGSSAESGGGTTGSTVAFWLNAYPKIALAAAILVLTFGIWLFVLFRRYFKRLSAEGKADELIALRYEEDRERINGLHTVEGMRIFLMLLTVSVALGIDLVFDHVNVLPDLLSALLLIVSLLFLARRFEGVGVGKCVAFAGGYAAVSLISTVLSILFYEKYGLSSLEVGDAAAKRLYLFLTVSSAVEAALAIVVWVYLFLILARLIPLAISPVSGHLSRQTDEIERGIRRRNVAFLIASVVTSLAGLIEVILSSMTTSVLLDPDAGVGTSAQVLKVDWFWMVPLVLSIIRMVMMFRITEIMTMEAREKYIYE